MADFILANEREIYSVSYFLTLALVVLWEMTAPRRVSSQSLKRRWGNNFALTAIDVVLVRLAFPAAAVGMAFLAQERGIGLFNIIDAPFWLAAIAGILVVDFTRYLQHFLLHRLPLLWRLHRVHHTDLDYDFSVGLRFHPLEAFYSTIFVLAAVLAIGAPPASVAVFEAVTAVSGLFVHANARTPSWLERWGRLIIVTPDMHRIHHSTRREEHDRNFAGVFSLWDRLFGTYLEAPVGGHQGMTIGLADERDPKCLGLLWMLTAPFTRQPAPESLGDTP